MATELATNRPTDLPLELDPVDVTLPDVDDNEAKAWYSATTWNTYDAQKLEDERQRAIEDESIRERVTIPLESIQKCFWAYDPAFSSSISTAPGYQDGVPDFHFPIGLMDHAQTIFQNSFSDIVQLASFELPSGFSLPKSVKEVDRRKDGDGRLYEPSITLHCPHDLSPDVLDYFVRKLATSQEADVLVIGAVEIASGEHGLLGQDFREIVEKTFEGDSNCDEDEIAHRARQVKRYFNALMNANISSASSAMPQVPQPSPKDDPAGNIRTSAADPPSPGRRLIVYMRDFGAIAQRVYWFLEYLVDAIKAWRAESISASLGHLKKAHRLVLPSEDAQGELADQTKHDAHDSTASIDPSVLSRVVIVYGVSKDPYTEPAYCCGGNHRRYPPKFEKAFDSGELSDLQLILPHIGMQGDVRVPIYVHFLESLIYQYEGEHGGSQVRVNSEKANAYYGSILIVYFSGVTVRSDLRSDKWWELSRKAARARRCLILNDLRIRAAVEVAGAQLANDGKRPVEHFLADIPILQAIDSGDVTTIASITDQHKASDTTDKDAIPFASPADFLHRIIPADVAERMAKDALKATAKLTNTTATAADPNSSAEVSAALIAKVHKEHSRVLAERKQWLKTQKAKREKSGSTEDPIITKVKAMELNEHEQRLMSGVVDTSVISTTFKDVCVEADIIDSIRTIVSLPLLYPSAFSSGILGKEAMSGILLYGPPGTGKTMLCRALAKECKVRMLQVAPSSVKDMWVGETEKLVKAVFTLARKLAPCVIFIDELDAIFGGRGGSGYQRSMLTEFMQEMDGLRTAGENKEKGVIIVGCTNRPFDLDDAIIRRLPRRVMVDLPGQKHREQILGVHLRGETLEGIDIPEIARRAEYYSGSDLKNLCVSAALASLKDTLPARWALTDEQGGDQDGQSPFGMTSKAIPQLAPRVVRLEHFEHAFTQVTASCTSEMQSVKELRAWESTFASGARTGSGGGSRPSAPPPSMDRDFGVAPPHPKRPAHSSAEMANPAPRMHPPRSKDEKDEEKDDSSTKSKSREGSPSPPTTRGRKNDKDSK